MYDHAEDIPALECLVAALERMQVPTFIVRRDGLVGYANALARSRAELRVELGAAIAGQPTAAGFVSTRIGTGAWYLVSCDNEVAETCRARARRRYQLTARQEEVLELVIGGATNRTVAELLGITERTVEVHLTAIYARVGVENRASLLSRVLQAA